MTQAFTVQQDELAVAVPLPRGRKLAAHAQPLHQRRQQPSEVRSVVAGKPVHRFHELRPVCGCKLPQQRPVIPVALESRRVKQFKTLLHRVHDFIHQLVETFVLLQLVLEQFLEGVLVFPLRPAQPYP